MKTGGIASAFGIVIVVLGGLIGAGMIFDKYFGGAEQREVTSTLTKRADNNDVTNQRQDATIDKHNDRLNANDIVNARQDADNVRTNGRVDRVEAKNAEQDERTAALEAVVAEQAKAIEANQAAIAAGDAAREAMGREQATQVAELRRQLETEQEARKHQEERIRRIERIIGVGDPQQ